MKKVLGEMLGEFRQISQNLVSDSVWQCLIETNRLSPSPLIMVSRSPKNKIRGNFLPSTSLIHLAVHKDDKVLLTPELFLLLLNEKR